MPEQFLCVWSLWTHWNVCLCKFLSKEQCRALLLDSCFISLEFLYQCSCTRNSFFLSLQTLPCLVRMCSKDRLLEERVEGAETLAYLIETDVELQRMASITDHLIVMLADYFKYPSSVSAITDIKRVRFLSRLSTLEKWPKPEINQIRMGFFNSG